MPRTKASTKQITQTHHIAGEGSLVERFAIRQIIATPNNKNTTAVATCPLASKIRKMPIATNNQNQGELGGLILMPLDIANIVCFLLNTVNCPVAYLKSHVFNSSRHNRLFSYKAQNVGSIPSS